MSKKVVTFGEIMLRLAPEGYYRFVQAETFGATYGSKLPEKIRRGYIQDRTRRRQSRYLLP